MTNISWYETLEGKLSICLAVLLVIFSLVLTYAEEPRNTDPLTGTGRALTAQTLQETRASNLAELPPLTPYETSPLQTPQSVVAPTPTTNTYQAPAVSESTKQKPRKHRYPLLMLLFP